MQEDYSANSTFMIFKIKDGTRHGLLVIISKSYFLIVVRNLIISKEARGREVEDNKPEFEVSQ